MKIRIVLYALALSLFACGVIEDAQDKIETVQSAVKRANELRKQLKDAKIHLEGGRFTITVRKHLPGYVRKPLACYGYPHDGKLYDKLTGEQPLFSVNLKGLRKDADEYLKSRQQAQANKPKGTPITAADVVQKVDAPKEAAGCGLSTQTKSEDTAELSYQPNNASSQATGGSLVTTSTPKAPISVPRNDGQAGMNGAGSGEILTDPAVQQDSEEGESCPACGAAPPNAIPATDSSTANNMGYPTAGGGVAGDDAMPTDTDGIDGNETGGNGNGGTSVSSPDDTPGQQSTPEPMPSEGPTRPDTKPTPPGHSDTNSDVDVEPSEEPAKPAPAEKLDLPPVPKRPGKGLVDDLFFVDKAYYNALSCSVELVAYNKDKKEENVWQLSADDSTSVLSPQSLQTRIDAGAYFDPKALRNYEFFNYYNFGYAAPAAGAKQPFTVHPEAMVVLNKDSQELELFLQIGLASREVPKERTTPLEILLLIDESGSMLENDRYKITLAAADAIVDHLEPQDRLGIVFFNRTTRVGLPAFTTMDKAGRSKARKALDTYSPNDGTIVYDAMETAYDVFKKSGSKDKKVQRALLLFTDGFDQSSFGIPSLVRRHLSDNILVSGFAVGSDFNEDFLETLTEASRGGAYLLDSEKSVPRRIAESFSNLVEVAARDIWFLLELPDTIQMVQFYGEKAIRGTETKLDEQTFMVNDTLILLQKISLYHPKAVDEKIKLTVTWKDPATGKPGKSETSFTLKKLLGKPTGNILKATAINKYAEFFSEAVQLGDQERHADVVLRSVQIYHVLEETAALIDDDELRDLKDQLADYMELYQDQWCGLELAEKSTASEIRPTVEPTKVSPVDID